MVQKANNDSEILNLNYRIQVDKVQARVLSVQLIFSGSFRSSSPKVAQQKVIIRTQGLALEIP